MRHTPTVSGLSLKLNSLQVEVELLMGYERNAALNIAFEVVASEHQCSEVDCYICN